MSRYSDLQVSFDENLDAEMRYYMTQALGVLRVEHIFNLQGFTTGPRQFLYCLKTAIMVHVYAKRPDDCVSIIASSIDHFPHEEWATGNPDAVYAILEQIAFEAGGEWVYPDLDLSRDWNPFSGGPESIVAELAHRARHA